jgi:beta-N-acetylhexosaminidase
VQRRISRLILSAALTAGAALSVAPASAATQTAEPDASEQSVGGPGQSDDAPYRGMIISMLRHMTVEEKVGQLFVVEVFGQDANNVNDVQAASNEAKYGSGVRTPADVINKYKPGGVIYFDPRRGGGVGGIGPDNVQNPRQIATLSNGLQAAATSQRMGIPLLISTDQEGGAVVYRLVAPATAMPGNMALGAGRSADDAKRSAEVIGTELASVGINQDFAPVSDVNINPANPVIGVRSVGADSDLVAKLVAAQVDGYHAAGIASTAKHFPGHGDTAVDSHFGLPEITHTRAQLEAIDLPPFKAAIAHGIESIMTAHIVVRSVDPSGAPATMSKPIMTGILREELGFDGLIVTDALGMGGATSTYPPDVAPVQALKAGVDQLLLSPDMNLAYDAVLRAVRTGDISQERLDESVYRILRLKFRHGVFDDPYVDVDRAVGVVGAPDHLADAQKITDHTTTLVKNDAGVLPLSHDSRRVLVTGRSDQVLFGDTIANLLSNDIRTRGQTVTTFGTNASPTQAQISQAAALAANVDLVVVTTNNANAAQQNLVSALLASGKPVVWAGVRNPYDIAGNTSAPTYLATYGFTPDSIESSVRVMYGEVNPSGKLPVTIPTADGTGVLYPFGHGLSY